MAPAPPLPGDPRHDLAGRCQDDLGPALPDRFDNLACGPLRVHRDQRRAGAEAEPGEFLLRLTGETSLQMRAGAHQAGYDGELDPMPMMEIFDRGVQLRVGQAHVKRWIDDLLPMVSDSSDPLGVVGFATHHLPLAEAPRGYDMFRDKADGCIKVVLQP
jgi:hypothetical protein